MKYDVDYFRSKFEAIPEEKVMVGWNSGCCALAICGANQNWEGVEAEALGHILLRHPIVAETTDSWKDAVWMVNDRWAEWQEDVFGASSPRGRIIAALRDIKEKDLTHA